VVDSSDQPLNVSREILQESKDVEAIRKACTSRILGLLEDLAGSEETVSFGRFGPVALYYGPQPPAHVVLFVSGDGGWNLGVVDMARALAGLDALVVGVDITHYLKELAASSESCLYPAADFEALSKFAQKKAGIPEYRAPVLVGYSSGATLVYATLVQAPPAEFKGGISLGFCPDLILPKPPCRGSGLQWESVQKGNKYVFLPAPGLEVPWVALQGLDDQVCAPAVTEDFVRRTRGASVVKLPKVGHGFLQQQNWMPQLKDALSRIASAPPPENAVVVRSLEDLPLVEVRAAGAERDILALHITGDGGWGVTDKGLAADLAANGIPVVALNSLKYFWTKRTPEGAAADLERILRLYLTVWGKRKVALIGYSLGADVLPFMLNRLPEDLQAAVGTAVLMGPSESAEFEFHLGDWLGRSPGKDALPVVPEIERMRKEIAILCVYGEKDDAHICGKLDPARARSIGVQTGHRFGGNFAPISKAVLDALRER
jgi:type IV secretory pathway VirJ component